MLRNIPGLKCFVGIFSGGQRTSNLASLNSDAMQVLPNGINFDSVARVFYQESNGIVDLELVAQMDSYNVSIVDTPEPAAWSIFLIGAGLLATRKLKN